MKSTTITLMTVLALSSFGAMASDNAVKVSCEFKVKKNKTDLNELKESTIKNSFTIKDMWETNSTVYGFKRVVPFLSSSDDDKETKKKSLVKRKSERVILFDADNAEESIDSSILYGIGKVAGKLRVIFSIDKVNKDGSKVVKFKTSNPKGTLHSGKRFRTFKLAPGDKETIEMKEDIKFEYTDYSYKGFLGISGWFNDEVEVTGKKFHLGQIKYKCIAELPKAQEVEETEEETDLTEVQADELEGFAIERNAPSVVEE